MCYCTRPTFARVGISRQKKKPSHRATHHKNGKRIGNAAISFHDSRPFARTNAATTLPSSEAARPQKTFPFHHLQRWSHISLFLSPFEIILSKIFLYCLAIHIFFISSRRYSFCLSWNRRRFGTTSWRMAAQAQSGMFDVTIEKERKKEREREDKKENDAQFALTY